MITGDTTVLGVGTRSNQKVRTSLIKVRYAVIRLTGTNNPTVTNYSCRNSSSGIG